MDYGSKRKWFLGFICGIVLIFTASCAKKVQTTQIGEISPPKPKQEVVTPPPPEVQEQSKPPEKALPLPSPAQLADILFDFDKAMLRSDNHARLKEDVRWLKENLNARITIEGHCDERGTGEYNLVLGEKRASAIKGYFQSEGIDRSRIKTISYGRERPFCKEHNEQCWQENRRGHFVERAEGS